MNRLVITLACVLFASVAEATTIVNNISTDANAFFVNFALANPGWAQRFRVPSTGSISEIQFNLFKGGASGATIFARITGDSGGLPDFGQTVYTATLTDAEIPTNRPNTVTLTPNAAVSANTNYWLTLNIMDATPGGNYGWSVGPSTNSALDSSTGSPAGSFKQAEYDTGVGPWVTSTGPSAAFGLKVVVVPEPASLVLCGAAVAGWRTLRRQKQA